MSSNNPGNGQSNSGGNGGGGNADSSNSGQTSSSRTKKLDSIDVGVGEGRGTEVDIQAGGETFKAKVVEYENRIVVYYDSLMENELPQRSAKLQRLNQAPGKVGLGSSDKDVQFKAI